MNTVESHYAQPGLLERVNAALRESGFDPEHLKQADLEKVDQFHVGAVDATDALAGLAGINASDRVLDLGSGIGGPSRHLASSIGCHVTGLDLTAEYCQVANALALAVGLSDVVVYRQGDALHAPFEDASCDVVWTQHAAMNIADKAGLYREIARLLKPGGRVAIHDVLAGSGEVRFPVPWASRPEFSFLITESDMQSKLESAGFRKVAWEDVTKVGTAGLKRVAAGAAVPGFGIRTLMGPQFPAMAANLIANLETGACRVIQAVYVI